MKDSFIGDKSSPTFFFGGGEEARERIHPLSSFLFTAYSIWRINKSIVQYMQVQVTERLCMLF